MTVSKNIIFRGIHFIYIIFILMLVFSTLLIDNKSLPTNNTVYFHNGVYFAIAVGLLLILTLIFKSHQINKTLFIILMIIIPLLVLFFLQIPISKWIYWNRGIDFKSIYDAAIGLNSGQSFKDFQYFSTSPNNVNLAIFVSWIYGIVKNWRHVILFTAICANLSAVMTSLSVFNYTKKYNISIIILIISEFLLALNWRAFVVYSDAYAMFFCALFMWIYSTSLKSTIKYPILIFSISAGMFIKVTVLILLIAFFIITVVKEFNTKDSLKGKCIRITYLILITTLFLGGTSLFQSHQHKVYGLDTTGNYPKTMYFLLMVGQNNESIGSNNTSDRTLRKQFIEEAKSNNKDNSYVNGLLLNEAKKRILNRGGFKNQILFILKKINIVYSDGCFNNNQSLPDSKEEQDLLESSIFYNLMIQKDGKYYELWAGLFQVFWNFILVLLIMGGYLGFKSDDFKLFELIIIGVTLYVLLFEGRAKYLLIFLPTYLAAGGYVMYMLWEKQVSKKIRNK